MDFLCLSAYWRSLLGSSLSHWGIQSSLRLTYWKSRPHWGYHVPHVRDATEEGVSFTAGTGYPRIRFIRPNSVPRLVRPRFIVPSSPYQPYFDDQTSRSLIRDSLAFTHSVFLLPGLSKWLGRSLDVTSLQKTPPLPVMPLEIEDRFGH